MNPSENELQKRGTHNISENYCSPVKKRVSVGVMLLQERFQVKNTFIGRYIDLYIYMHETRIRAYKKPLKSSPS